MRAVVLGHIPRATVWALVLVVLGLGAGEAQGEGATLDGRMAPELVFPAGLNGVGPGTRLSDFRGKVVWIKFWLRDCPHCRAALPAFQEMHERWSGRGLVVLSVLHDLPPSEVAPFMAQHGYSFPVGVDPDGQLARRYGVRLRPVDYVVGIDGRIKSSNGAPTSVLEMELGRYRLAALGRVPPELEPVRVAVWNRELATALRLAAEAAQQDGAAPEVVELAARVTAVAREEAEGVALWALALERRRDLGGAREVLERLAEHFAGTSVGPYASSQREAFRARTGL